MIGVIGSCNVDLVTFVERMPSAGETMHAPRFATSPGGKGANQAVAAARLGSAVTMVACVGGDLFGADTVENLSAAGIDVRHVRRVEGVSNGVATILVEPGGENRIMIVDGANADLSPADVDQAAADLAACRLLLLQLEVPVETVYHAIAWAERAGVPVLLNPAPGTAALDLERIRSVAFLVPNQTELTILTGLPAGTVDEATAAARVLVGRGIGAVVVTLGADGALLVSGSEVVLIAPVAVSARDTTGAGDAFVGAFAHYLVAGWGVRACLERASAYAAMSVTREGAQPSFATAEEFESFRSRPLAGA